MPYIAANFIIQFQQTTFVYRYIILHGLMNFVSPFQHLYPSPNQPTCRLQLYYKSYIYGLCYSVSAQQKTTEQNCSIVQRNNIKAFSYLSAYILHKNTSKNNKYKFRFLYYKFNFNFFTNISCFISINYMFF